MTRRFPIEHQVHQAARPSPSCVLPGEGGCNPIGFDEHGHDLLLPFLAIPAQAGTHASTSN
jgi:hypothetical protein